MFTNLLKTIKEYIHGRPKIKKTVGAVLVLIGLAAFVTPLTPGSWLAIIGLELLGVRILLSDPLRRRFSEASKLKFCLPTKADPPQAEKKK